MAGLPGLMEVRGLSKNFGAVQALSARGLRAVGRRAVPVEALERLEEALRSGRRTDGVCVLGPVTRQALGWSEADLEAILRGLDFTPSKGLEGAWRKRRQHASPAAVKVDPASPFATADVVRTEWAGDLVAAFELCGLG